MKRPAWQAEEDRHALGVYPRRPVCLVRGEGVRVWDAEGRSYLDCVAGVGTALLGHAHPRVAAALAAQAGRLATCYELFYNDTRRRFLAALARWLPPGLDRFFLCNSGAEAVEGALKIARWTTRRSRIVAARRGYHGKTLGALSVTWEPRYRQPAEPLLPDVVFAPYGDAEAFSAAVDERTAAVILEPIQGEGGIRVPPPDFLPAVAARCREVGALLVLDEVQTGCGRTGTFLAAEAAGVVPDIVTLAKGIGGGVPLAVVACGPRVQDLPPRFHTSTFGGNPLACAAGLAVLEALRAEQLPERAARLGERLRAGLAALQHPLVREVRGRGLLVGLELRRRAGPYLEALLQAGVLALGAGSRVIRFLPPLVITAGEVDQVVEAVGRALDHGA